MISAGREKTLIPRSELPLALGIVLMARDGRRKVLPGVYTDVDLVSEMTAFYGLDPTIGKRPAP